MPPFGVLPPFEARHLTSSRNFGESNRVASHSIPPHGCLKSAEAFGSRVEMFAAIKRRNDYGLRTNPSALPHTKIPGIRPAGIRIWHKWNNSPSLARPPSSHQGWIWRLTDNDASLLEKATCTFRNSDRAALGQAEGVSVRPRTAQRVLRELATLSHARSPDEASWDPLTVHRSKQLRQPYGAGTSGDFARRTLLSMALCRRAPRRCCGERSRCSASSGTVSRRTNLGHPGVFATGGRSAAS